jgi:hypothetical protein
MAFQVGTKVDPRLGALDFSGFTNAANIQAQSIAQLGAAIGGAIQVSKAKKEEKALSKQAQEMVFGFLKSNPEQANFFGLSKDFEMSDVKPIIDVVGAKPSIALMMELNMASMKAQTPSLPSVTQAQKFDEYLATLGGGQEIILKDGMLYDDDLITDDVIPYDDPIVQQALRTKEGQAFLTGYKLPEPLELNKEDEDIDVNVPVDESVKTSQRTPPESEFMRFGTFDARF